MHLEAHSEVKFSEPDAVSPVELRVHDDLTEVPAIIGDAKAESLQQHNDTANSTESNSNSLTSGSKYQTFSDGFGCATRLYSRHPIEVSGNSKAKQLFNTVYFALGAIAIGTVCAVWQFHLLWPAVAIFSAFAMAAFSASVSNRAHPSDFAVNLSRGTRRSLRALALIVPIPFMAILFAQPLAQIQLNQGHQLFTDGKYKDAQTHFKYATMLNPRLEPAFMELADCYNFTSNYNESVETANKALSLEPEDGQALAAKAWAFNALNRPADALSVALEAIKHAPTNGQAFHSLADAYVALGDYESALAPASKHIQIHSSEASALELRATILEKLGRSDEAAQDRKQAEQLRNNSDN